MLLSLIDDMNKALDNDCFFSALSLALTLPDICGKAKYPTDGNKKLTVVGEPKILTVVPHFTGLMVVLSIRMLMTTKMTIAILLIQMAEAVC